MGAQVLSLSTLELLNEDNPNSLLFARYAFMLLQNGDVEEAISIAENGVEKNPNYIAGLMVLAQAYLADGKSSGAERQLYEVIKRESHNCQAISLLAKIYELNNKPKIVDDLFGVLKHIHPSDIALQGKYPNEDIDKTIFEILGLTTGGSTAPSENVSKKDDSSDGWGDAPEEVAAEEPSQLDSMLEDALGDFSSDDIDLDEMVDENLETLTDDSEDLDVDFDIDELATTPDVEEESETLIEAEPDVIEESFVIDEMDISELPDPESSDGDVVDEYNIEEFSSSELSLDELPDPDISNSKSEESDLSLDGLMNDVTEDFETPVEEVEIKEESILDLDDSEQTMAVKIPELKTEEDDDDEDESPEVNTLLDDVKDAFDALPDDAISTENPPEIQHTEDEKVDFEGDLSVDDFDLTEESSVDTSDISLDESSEKIEESVEEIKEESILDFDDSEQTMAVKIPELKTEEDDDEDESPEVNTLLDDVKNAFDALPDDAISTENSPELQHTEDEEVDLGDKLENDIPIDDIDLTEDSKIESSEFSLDDMLESDNSEKELDNLSLDSLIDEISEKSDVKDSSEDKEVGLDLTEEPSEDSSDLSLDDMLESMKVEESSDDLSLDGLMGDSLVMEEESVLDLEDDSEQTMAVKIPMLKTEENIEDVEEDESPEVNTLLDDVKNAFDALPDDAISSEESVGIEDFKVENLDLTEDSSVESSDLSLDDMLESIKVEESIDDISFDGLMDDSEDTMAVKIPMLKTEEEGEDPEVTAPLDDVGNILDKIQDDAISGEESLDIDDFKIDDLDLVEESLEVPSEFSLDDILESDNSESIKDEFSNDDLSLDSLMDESLEIEESVLDLEDSSVFEEVENDESDEQTMSIEMPIASEIEVEDESAPDMDNLLDDVKSAFDLLPDDSISRRDDENEEAFNFETLDSSEEPILEHNIEDSSVDIDTISENELPVDIETDNMIDSQLSAEDTLIDANLDVILKQAREDVSVDELLSDIPLADSIEDELITDDKNLLEPTDLAIAEAKEFKEKMDKDGGGDAIPDHVLTPTFAKIYRQQGQFKLAKEIYERLLESDPDNIDFEDIILDLNQEILDAAESEKIRKPKPLAGKKINKAIRAKLKGKTKGEK
jgi:tetratricopeptide (TPR) repeat protein